MKIRLKDLAAAMSILQLKFTHVRVREITYDAHQLRESKTDRHDEIIIGYVHVISVCFLPKPG